MSAALHEPPRWSWRRWVGVTLAVLALQVALVFYFGERPRPWFTPAPSTTRILSANDPWAAEQLAGSPGLTDPTLFALPHLEGFSGRAWLLFGTPSNQLREWSEPPRWLDLSGNWLADGFSLLTSTNVLTVLRVADKPLPRPTGLDLPVPNEPLATQSVVHVRGDLAGRPLLESISARSWPSADFLTNSEVQLLVDHRGDVRSTVLLAESGSREVDEYALRRAAAARFVPLPPTASGAGRLTWGRLEFHWATLPPTATNTPSGTL